MSKYQFSNVVVVDDDQIGVIVKTWNAAAGGYNYDVYVRSYSEVRNYSESEIQHYVFSKYLAFDEREFYN